MKLSLPAAILSLCLAGTALGQTLTITDDSMAVIVSTANPIGSLTYSTAFNTQLSQTFTVAAQQNNGQPLPVTLLLQVNPQQNGQIPSWLRFCNGSIVCLPNTDNSGTRAFTVTINPAGLSQGTYAGSFSVAINSLPASKLTINVTLNVNVGTAVISANPLSLQFTAFQGATAASASALNLVINSTLPGVTFNLATQTSSGGNWLKLPGGTSNLTPGLNNIVIADPTFLGTGTYNGTILVNASTGDSLQVPVTLNITAIPTITITPANPAPFLYQIGGALPAAQTISITPTSPTPVFFTFSSQASWLVPNPPSGFAIAPAFLQVGVNVAGMPVGIYETTLTLFLQGGNSISIPFRLLISPAAPPGAPLPPTAILTLTGLALVGLHQARRKLHR